MKDENKYERVRKRERERDRKRKRESVREIQTSLHIS
jgi:hypothetical protein